MGTISVHKNKAQVLFLLDNPIKRQEMCEEKKRKGRRGRKKRVKDEEKTGRAEKDDVHA